MFHGFNGQNIFCSITDSDERVVFINDAYYFLDERYWPENSTGNHLITNMNNHMLANTDKQDHSSAMLQMKIFVEALHTVITLKQNKMLYRIMRHREGFSFLVKSICLPIITANNETLGAYMLSWCANPLNISTLLHSNFAQLSNEEIIHSINQIALSTREHQIIYLLLNKFSQYEIANLLEISRGMVQRIINEQLCQKFKIFPQNTSALLDIAHRLGYHLYFPPSLMEYKFMQEAHDEVDITQFHSNLACGI